MGLMDKPMAKLEERFAELRAILQQILEELRAIRAQGGPR